MKQGLNTNSDSIYQASDFADSARHWGTFGLLSQAVAVAAPIAGVAIAGLNTMANGNFNAAAIPAAVGVAIGAGAAVASIALKSVESGKMDAAYEVLGNPSPADNVGFGRFKSLCYSAGVANHRLLKGHEGR